MSFLFSLLLRATLLIHFTNHNAYFSGSLFKISTWFTAFPTTTRKEVPAAAEPLVPPPWEKRGCCSRGRKSRSLAVCAHDITATIHRRAKRGREGELAGERERRPQLPLKGRTV